MRLRTTATTILALGLVAGSAGGAAAQDEASACPTDAAIAPDAIEAGSHCADALGPAIEFDTSHDWAVPLQAPGTLILQDPEAAPPVQALLLSAVASRMVSQTPRRGSQRRMASRSSPRRPPRSAASTGRCTTSPPTCPLTSSS